MIERLVTTLEVLAAPADEQVARFPDVAGQMHAIGLDYADALLLITDCQQVLLTPEQQAALERVDDLLEALRGAGSSPWTESALRDGAEWRAIRRDAGEALRLLG
jgi:hypothetical protein